MEVSTELVQGFAAGEAAVRAAGEQVARDTALAEDEAWVGPDRSVKSRFLELLEQYPKMTQEQAYLLAVMERIGHQGYLVPPELAPGVLAQLESNDH